jgi:hypothetical protein
VAAKTARIFEPHPSSSLRTPYHCLRICITFTNHIIKMAADPPLLPISVPVTGKITIRTLSPIDRTIPPRTAVLIHALAFGIFSVSSVWSAVWAVYGPPGFSNYQVRDISLGPPPPYSSRPSKLTNSSSASPLPLPPHPASGPVSSGQLSVSTPGSYISTLFAVIRPADLVLSEGSSSSYRSSSSSSLL